MDLVVGVVIIGVIAAIAAPSGSVGPNAGTTGLIMTTAAVIQSSVDEGSEERWLGVPL